MKLTFLIHNSPLLLKDSQRANSNLNGLVCLELLKVVNTLSKLDPMMDLECGSITRWLLIIGVNTELNIKKTQFHLVKVIMKLKFTNSKTLEVQLLMPTGTQNLKLILNQFMFITKVPYELDTINVQTQYI